jgi:hypothetical protein
LGPIPNPQSPIPNPQSPIPIFVIIQTLIETVPHIMINYFFKIKNKI